VKIRHRVPSVAFRGADPVTPEYQAQVDRSTEKAAVAYARAERNLRAAERRLARADARLLALSAAGKKSEAAKRAREVRVAAELVELRREEWLILDRLMKAVPSSTLHRGSGKGHRAVPAQGSIV
jgi:hypothetical protein